MGKGGFSPQIPKVVHNFFRWSGNTESELTGSAVATCTVAYEANEATASVKFVDSVKI